MLTLRCKMNMCSYFIEFKNKKSKEMEYKIINQFHDKVLLNI